MYSNEVSKQEKKSLWRFGTKEVVYAAIGAALYAVVTWAFNVGKSPVRVMLAFARQWFFRCFSVSLLVRLSVSSPALWATSSLTCSAAMVFGSGGILGTASWA